MTLLLGSDTIFRFFLEYTSYLTTTCDQFPPKVRYIGSCRKAICCGFSNIGSSMKTVGWLCCVFIPRYLMLFCVFVVLIRAVDPDHCDYNFNPLCYMSSLLARLGQQQLYLVSAENIERLFIKEDKDLVIQLCVETPMLTYSGMGSVMICCHCTVGQCLIFFHLIPVSCATVQWT